MVSQFGDLVMQRRSSSVSGGFLEDGYPRAGNQCLAFGNPAREVGKNCLPADSGEERRLVGENGHETAPATMHHRGRRSGSVVILLQ